MKKITITLSFIAAAFSFSTNAQTITTTGNLATARAAHQSQKLPGGNIIAMGGDNYNLASFSTFKSCEIYNAVAGTWSAAATMNDRRSYFSSVVLNSGNILVMGGYLGDYYTGSPYVRKSCEIYNVTSNTWSYTDSMHNGRVGSFAVKLASGKVLVAGGGSNVSEIYDPSTGLWTTGSSCVNLYVYASIVTLPNGNVLLTGGMGDNKGEVYDTASGTWAAPVTMVHSHYYHSSLLMNNGKVLIIGGMTRLCEEYDPVANTFTQVDSLITEQNNCPSALLASGNALIFGIGNWFAPVNSKCIQVYNVTTNVWNDSIYNTVHYYGAAAYTINQLMNGKFLISGGSYTTGNGASTICYLVSGGVAGINEQDVSSIFQLYPNPTTSELRIRSEEFKIESVRVYNVIGECVKDMQIKQNTDVHVDMSELKSGIYFVRIEDENKNIINRKIIKE